MKLRLITIFLLALVCIAVIGGCSKEDPNLSKNEESSPYVPNTDPVPIENPDQSFSDMLGIYNETEYTQITVQSTKSVYSLKDDKVIACDVSNQNIGHGFYVYAVPYIERLDDGKWIRQCNKYATDEQFHLQWTYCGVENNKEGINSTRLSIAYDDISPKVTPGHYRLVVFTPKNIHYAEFEIQK